MDTILIIGSRTQAITKAREMGLRVVLLQHKARLMPGQVEAADATILVDYLDTAATLPLVRAAHAVYGFTKVVSLAEQAMELVGRINDDLGLDGTTFEVAHRFHDKALMRSRLRGTGFEDVAARIVEGPEELRAFGARHGYPVVLKPTDSAGSRGVYRIDGPDEVESAWESASGLRGRDDLPMGAFYPVGHLIAEEYLDGPEYSVETFSFAGRHVVVAITEKLTDRGIEIGHAQPALLAPADEDAMVRYTTGFLDAMGLRDGVGHHEIKFTSRGPRIVEGHDRVAGDRVMDLVDTVYGIDLERYAVGWPLRRVPELTGRPAARTAAATRFLTARPGIVERIEGVEEVRAYPGVFDVDIALRVGDEMPQVADNFDRPGQVLATALDTPAAFELCAMLVQKISIVTRPREAVGAHATGSGADASAGAGAEAGVEAGIGAGRR